MARYLLAASPLPGHVAPMQAVAADLRRRGDQVRLVTGAAFRASTRALGVEFSELPREAGVARAALPRGRASDLVRRWRTGRAELRSAFLAPISSQYRALCSELDRTEFDAVLVDVMFTGAIPLLLSQRKRPPVIACGVVPLMLSSADCPPFGIGWQPRTGRDYTAMNRFVQQVLFRGVQAELNVLLRALDLGPAPVFLLDWPLLADRILQFTVPGFEYPRNDLPPSVVFTGPISTPAAMNAAMPSWLPALGGAQKIVHVTQGTWDNQCLDQLLRPTLSALSQRSDVLVVACTGDSRTPIGPLPANAYATGFIPYDQLLPRVDVMITNGGYGGVNQALSYGVPLIVAGDTADKPETSARVAYTGAGIDLGTAWPRPAAIAAAVDRVLSSGSFRDAANRLASETADRSPFDAIATVLSEVCAGLQRAVSAPAVQERHPRVRKDE
ncbi:glycosyltransferase [Nocardia gipuzkoensis]|uniref:glycosyltransferase n=1 Tax=Nocardia gipuzkoensis TaxID=2749991 RepID=UPI001E360ED3|nr:nucleotide disphospho-sugar-binding domain-containing protein [Nocardia gipuzkoensis]UGT67739.1 glycosyltransferase [Nocardia gipuzkoensis]